MLVLCVFFPSSGKKRQSGKASCVKKRGPKSCQCQIGKDTQSESKTDINMKTGSSLLAVVTKKGEIMEITTEEDRYFHINNPNKLATFLALKARQSDITDIHIIVMTDHTSFVNCLSKVNQSQFI